MGQTQTREARDFAARQRLLAIRTAHLPLTNDWRADLVAKYEGHSVALVRPGLFVGSVRGAQGAEALRELGVTHVLNAADPVHREAGIALEREGFVVRYAPGAVDREGYDMLGWHLDDARELFAAARACGGACFVHCHAGQNRSVVLAAAELMLVDRVPVVQAVARLRSIRGPGALSTQSFQEQLVRLADEHHLLGPKPGSPASAARFIVTDDEAALPALSLDPSTVEAGSRAHLWPWLWSLQERCGGLAAAAAAAAAASSEGSTSESGAATQVAPGLLLAAHEPALQDLQAANVTHAVFGEANGEPATSRGLGDLVVQELPPWTLELEGDLAIAQKALSAARLAKGACLVLCEAARGAALCAALVMVADRALLMEALTRLPDAAVAALGYDRAAQELLVRLAHDQGLLGAAPRNVPKFRGVAQQNLQHFEAAQFDNEALWPWLWALDPNNVTLDWRVGLRPEAVDELEAATSRDHQCALVMPGLYLGPAKAAADPEFLRELGITHVFNAAGRACHSQCHMLLEAGGFVVTSVSGEDEEGFDMLGKFLETAHVAFASARRRGGACLVHCVAGLNRSAVLAAADLMLIDRVPVLQVVARIRKLRGRSALDNASFQAQLVGLAARHGLLGPLPGEPGSASPTAAPPFDPSYRANKVKRPDVRSLFA